MCYCVVVVMLRLFVCYMFFGVVDMRDCVWAGSVWCITVHTYCVVMNAL